MSIFFRTSPRQSFAPRSVGMAPEETTPPSTPSELRVPAAPIRHKQIIYVISRKIWDFNRKELDNLLRFEQANTPQRKDNNNYVTPLPAVQSNDQSGFQLGRGRQRTNLPLFQDTSDDFLQGLNTVLINFNSSIDRILNTDFIVQIISRQKDNIGKEIKQGQPEPLAAFMSKSQKLIEMMEDFLNRAGEAGPYRQTEIYVDNELIMNKNIMNNIKDKMTEVVNHVNNMTFKIDGHVNME